MSPVVHCVFCKIRADVSADALNTVMDALMALRTEIPGILSARHGVNIDLEKKSQGYTHGFLMQFSDRDALKAYHTHPAHKRAGSSLVEICEDGAEGIMVFDVELPPHSL